MNSLLTFNRNVLPLILTLWASAALAATGQGQEVSALKEIPNTGINITQELTGETKANLKFVPARFITPSERRGIAQTFTWNVESPLTGIGIKIASDEKKRFASAQNYFLDVQELTEASSDRSVKTTLASLPLVLTPESVQANEYLFVRLAKPLPLEKGKAYGFHFRPAEANGKNWLMVSINGVNPERPGYSGGVGSQTPAEMYKDGDRYGKDPAGREFDLTFFTTTSPEGSQN